MAGRGGRGAALLKALEVPARKPGAPSDQDAGDGPQITPQITAAAPKKSGRGSYLLNMIPKTVESPSTVEPTPVEPTHRSKQATARGTGLLQQAQPSPPRPVGPVKPLVPQPQSASTSSESELSQSMNKLNIEPKPKGTTGQRIQLSSNYVQLKSKSQYWYQYSVSYEPNVDSRGLRFRLLYTHEDIIGPARVFDGSILFLPYELSSKSMTLFSTNPYANEQVTVKLNLVKKIGIASKQCVQMYNIFFKRIMNFLNLVQIGRTGSSYDPRNAIPIPQYKLQIWPGYVTSIEQYEGGLLLLCDTSHKVLRDETAHDVMMGVFKNPRVPADRKKDQMMKALIGASVITRYNNKTYRIDDISFDIKPSSTFERREGPTSFVDYYSKQYGLTIRDSEQPMLISRPKQRDRKTGEKVEQMLCIIPELAHLTGLADEMTANHMVMKDIAKHTRVTPQQRTISLQKLLHNIRNNPEANAQLTMWGLELAPGSIQLEGRKLAPEQIVLGGRQRGRDGKISPFVGSAGPKADWTRDVANNPVINAVNLREWLLIFVSKDSNTLMKYVNLYKKVGDQLGIQVNEPATVRLDDDRTDSYVRAIRERVHKDLQLVVVVFPFKREDKYNAVKKLLCAEVPCPSQIIITKTIMKDKVMPIVQKIALQINAKLGGELWQVNMPLRSAMYVGIDVYHDGAKGKANSVVGMVASLNKHGTRYFSRIVMQSQREELVHALKVIFIAALRKYHQVNNQLPDKVIVFRDGVGDSMMEMVTEMEVKQLESCFSTFPDYNPGMAYVIVQKRISTRIYASQGRIMENAPPGTVLDHTVVKPLLCSGKWYDYYLVSQHVTQGTVTPTHYVVVYDTTALSPDKMQQLTYKMCHLYYNWSGTVRVPAPCQYAHKLAYLVGENVRIQPSELLEDKLYFL